VSIRQIKRIVKTKPKPKAWRVLVPMGPAKQPLLRTTLTRAFSLGILHRNRQGEAQDTCGIGIR
jgi:hypothetical protein